ASRLGAGRISALNYANHLVLLPHGVLALSLSTVIFPLMVRQYGLGQLDDVKQTLHRALGPLVFLTLPGAVSLFAFRASIVQTLFQFGSFTPESTALVATAVGYFAPGLLARAVVETTTRAFYAMHDTRTPVAVALLAIAANVALSWLLAPRLGHGGLALSISITSTLRMVVLLAILWRRVGGVGHELRSSLPRMVLAAAMLAAFALWLADPLARITDPTDGRTIWTYGALAAAGSLYVAAAYWLRIPECARLVHAARRRLGWTG
ncbi:MAG: murein biosynthesis integral membrane protein MurJ, partial [Thermomicrobiales bacterium]